MKKIIFIITCIILLTAVPVHGTYSRNYTTERKIKELEFAEKLLKYEAVFCKYIDNILMEKYKSDHVSLLSFLLKDVEEYLIWNSNAYSYENGRLKLDEVDIRVNFLLGHVYYEYCREKNQHQKYKALAITHFKNVLSYPYTEALRITKQEIEGTKIMLDCLEADKNIFIFSVQDIKVKDKRLLDLLVKTAEEIFNQEMDFTKSDGEDYDVFNIALSITELKDVHFLLDWALKIDPNNFHANFLKGKICYIKYHLDEGFIDIKKYTEAEKLLNKAHKIAKASKISKKQLMTEIEKLLKEITQDKKYLGEYGE